MRRTTAAVLILTAFAAGILFGDSAQREYRGQDANGLIQAGFTIVDPEGFEVERFGDR